MTVASVNPATGETLKTFPSLTSDEIEERVALAHRAFRDQRRTTFATRAAWMTATADVLDSRREDVARVMTAEMGKTIVSARAEAAKCARTMRFYAEHAEGFLADEPLADPSAVGAKAAMIRWQPLGVVLAVMPWNFPLWQVVRFAAPALMAGNTGLLKHASNVPQTALLLDELFREGGFPEGCFQALLIGSGQVEGVLRDPRVAAATLTGSEAAGRSVAAIAGDEVKKTVLELGGSDAFVVMPSADLEAAVATAVTGRVQNNGQSCIAAKRFIVHDAVFDAFAEAFTARMRGLRVGDPADEATDVGPLATESGREDVVELVDDAVRAGATVLCGGETPDGPGWFYPPTVLDGITSEMRIHTEEVFGPVAQLYRVSTADEAIGIANATSFGLGAAAWTTDADEKELFVNELEAGAVFVNGLVASSPQLPFGGIKRSGYGRELSALGIREFCNAKTVWVS
ncbi:NADP-dependent succinic semialdehyde dehydrogenase [Yinghuangia sp. ASG 101]|uniref:NADP-dependent succinic semialdehyde dehydrogenase n=1 Tax=Yinghuangia sp. ASG 101 TaxID=2896848 RepID=UPI001E546B88|nr:NADP-dependent succinic semialdehyde dehydrogenase [Yinghuangia sp. ASG 101]UGQ12225.1 NADP-dependent succinic semialdehyde dehydrogenase [Yinghuangia sp. ASG 101]